jgi:hypothetical protein
LPGEEVCNEPASYGTSEILRVRTEYVLVELGAPAVSLSMPLIMVCSRFDTPPDGSASAGSAPKLARYLFIAATLPTDAQPHSGEKLR